MVHRNQGEKMTIFHLHIFMVCFAFQDSDIVEDARTGFQMITVGVKETWVNEEMKICKCVVGE